MEQREQRIKRLFNPETGKAVMMPMDHGLGMGRVAGLEDPLQAFTRFVELGVDALLVNFGILKQTYSYRRGLDNVPGIIMGIDFIEIWNNWKTPIDRKGIIGYCITATVEQAVKYEADAVKVYYALGLDPQLQIEVIRSICKVISECDKYNMPIMIEPTAEGEYIPFDKKGDPQIIADGCRFALEMGADVIKAPYPDTDDKEVFAQICKEAHVPIVLLGGAKKGNVRSVLEIAKAGIEAGARGTIFGRNVWGRPNLDVVVKALQEVVHKNASVDEVCNKYGLD